MSYAIGAVFEIACRNFAVGIGTELFQISKYLADWDLEKSYVRQPAGQFHP